MHMDWFVQDGLVKTEYLEEGLGSILLGASSVLHCTEYQLIIISDWWIWASLIFTIFWQLQLTIFVNIFFFFWQGQILSTTTYYFFSFLRDELFYRFTKLIYKHRFSNYFWTLFHKLKILRTLIWSHVTPLHSPLVNSSYFNCNKREMNLF